MMASAARVTIGREAGLGDGRRRVDGSGRGSAGVALGARLYAALLGGAFLIYASANAPVPVAAEMRARLGLAGGDAALFLLPFAAGFGAGAFVWFALARRRSPRVLLPLSLVAAAAASVLLLAARTPEVAVAARVLVGAASAGYPAVAQAVITQGTHPAARGRLIGGFVAAVVAGSFLGQAATGLLADLASVGGALALLCVAAPLATAAPLARLAPSGPLATGTGAPRPSGVRSLLGRLAPVLAVSALAFGGYWLLLSELPVALRETRFHLTAAEAGALPALGLLGIVAALAAGRAADRVGRRTPMLVTLAVGILALLPTLPAHAPLWLFAGGYGLFLAAYWGYLPPASAEVAARSAPQDRQAALLAFYAAMWTGAAVAPAASAFLDWTQAALVTVAAWSVALLPAGRFGGGRPPAEVAAPAAARSLRRLPTADPPSSPGPDGRDRAAPPASRPARVD